MKVSQPSIMVSFTTKGQVVIPAALRREYHIKDGTRAAVVATADGILLKPVTREYIRSLRGSMKGKNLWETFLRERELDRRREA